MILFPNAKINLGLNVESRRADGYHNIATVMLPTGWHDVLEIVPAAGSVTTLTTYGRTVDCPPERNLVMKAYNALKAEVPDLPAADIYLQKIIPDGAGMGGGSADAAFTLIGLNEVFNLGLDKEKLATVAARIGADCPFFIYNTPAYCTGTGTDISHDVALPEQPLYIAIAKPRHGSVSTAEAYAAITPRQAEVAPIDAVKRPVEEWRNVLVNDFEASVFARLPQCAALKEHFYTSGAVYAAMSGSGSAVFGIFTGDKMAQSSISTLTDCDTFTGRLQL